VIDTLHLNLLDFEIDADTDLELDHGTTNLATGISTGSTTLFRCGDTPVIGKKAFYNAPDFNFSIAPTPQGAVYAIASFSAPKLATGSNYTPADAEALKLAVKRLKSDLKSIGVRANVDNATVCRLDATKNVCTNEDFNSYYSVLSNLPCKLKNRRDYGNSFLFNNTQQQLSIYDKLAEMQSKKQNIGGLPKTIRFEQRFLKRQKVKAYLGLTSVSDVINNLDHVAERYRDSMRSNIFKLDTFKYEVTTAQQFVSELIALKHLHAYAVSSYLMLKGYQSIANSEDAFLVAVEEVSGNRMAVSRAKKKLHQLKMESMSLETPLKSKKTSAQLYHELREKVLN
jgi:hypothetical protein